MSVTRAALRLAAASAAVALSLATPAAAQSKPKPQYGGTLEVGTVYVTLSALSFDPADWNWKLNHDTGNYLEQLFAAVPDMTFEIVDFVAARNTAARFSIARADSAAIPPATSLPVAGSSPTCPEQKTRSPAITACAYGPSAFGASSAAIRFTSAPSRPSSRRVRGRGCA